MCFRCDRCDLGDTREGGGVLIAIHLSLNPSTVVVPNTQMIEQVWAKISTNLNDVYFRAVYIPPNSPVEAYSQMVESAKDVVEK